MIQVLPKISKRAFWDVSFSTLDYEKYSLFVIQRVLEYGLFDDLKEIIYFYGKDRIAKEVVDVNWLSNKTLYFCCEIFSLKPNNFKCYTKKQSNPQLWNY
ncbi:MAG: hypothetical protein EAZ85_08335 [Bacteroidetes bacterium]|nr:MAG: hypothetical protein EAZ85_08335 [Bacteroidota bacterium]TAG89206.1 MAG: hypothetical protein EAZ20_06990 [Bacteroidota bacterium]